MRKKQILQIVIMAILTSLAVILKKFSIDTGYYRISLFDTPIILGGMIGGPIWGIAVGFSADLLYNVLSGYTYSFIMMFSTILWGIMGGIFYYVKPKLSYLIIAIFITSCLTTGINSIQLALWYSEVTMLAGLGLRILNMLIKWPITSTLVYILYKRVVYPTLYPLFKKNQKDKTRIISHKKRKLHFK